MLLKNFQSAITKLGVHELVWKREQDHLFLVLKGNTITDF
jgi:hypothetical protein